MKKTAQKLFLITLSFCLFAGPSFVEAHPNGHPVSPKFVDGSLLFDFKTSYYKTTENFDSGGSKQSLTSGNYFQLIDIESKLRWGVTENFGLFGGFTVGLGESNNSIATRKNSTLSEILIGGDWRPLRLQSMDLFTRLSYIHAPEKIAIDTDSVMNSSGSAQVVPEVGILMPLGVVNLYGSGGYNYRTEGLSGLLMYRVGVELALSSFSLYGGVDGFASVTDDKETANSINRDIINNRVNAGSKKFYAVNPNETNVEVGLNYQINPSWGFNGFAQYTVVGSNSAAGFLAGGGVSWELAQVEVPRSKLRDNKGVSRDTVPTDFTEDTNDGVNQDYFKQVPSPTDSPKKVTPVPPQSQVPQQEQPQVESSSDAPSMEEVDAEIITKRKKQQELKIKLKRKKK